MNIVKTGINQNQQTKLGNHPSFQANFKQTKEFQEFVEGYPLKTILGEKGKIAQFLQLLYSDATALTIQGIKATKIGTANGKSVAEEIDPNIRFIGKNPNTYIINGDVAYELEARTPQNFLQALFNKKPQDVGKAEIIIKDGETLTPKELIEKFLDAMQEAAKNL